MREPARSEFIKSLKVVDPVQHIGTSIACSGVPPVEKAEEFWQATREPKRIVFHDAEHRMNDTAKQDRVAWLKEALRLR